MSCDSNSSDVEDDFKGFQVEDYNNCLADKNKFLSLISDIYSDFKTQQSSAKNLPPAKSIPILKINKTSVDTHEALLANVLNNPLLKIPLTQYGWKREIVCRTSNSPEISRNRMYDVYYYSPYGKKLRSATQVSEYLTTIETELSSSHFSFSKGVIGLSSNVEWVRDARSRDGVQNISTNTNKLDQNKIVPNKPSKNVKKRRLSKVSYDDYGVDEYESKRKVLKTSLEDNFERNRSNVSFSEDDMDSWSPTIPGTTRETMRNPLTCSILCPLALGCIPTLQCTSCLCLYHPQCLKLDPDNTYPKYVCINCKNKIQDEEKEINYKKEHSSKKIIKITKSSFEQKVPVITTINKTSKQKPFISCVSKVLQKIPKTVTTQYRPKVNYNMIRPKLSYTMNKNKPSRPLAPVSAQNNAMNMSRKLTSKLNVPMQSIVHFGNKKFIAVPKKILNSIANNTSSVTDSRMSSENQVPIIVKPTVIGAPKSQFYFLKNSQINPTLSGKPTHEQATIVLNPPTPIKKPSSVPNENFLSTGSGWFNILVTIFSHLPLCDLLRAAQVNQLFYAASRHYSLWKSIYLADTYVNDWEKLAHCLSKNDTRSIDFNRMITKADPDVTKLMWQSINKALGKIPTLCELNLGRCAGPEIVLIKQCLNLTYFSCSFNKKSLLDFYGFPAIQNLSHLYIKGHQLSKAIGLKVLNIHTLSKLENLTHLALTSVKQSSEDTNWAMFLADLPKLKWLELGECTNFTNEFVNHTLTKLVNLKHLRLEMVTELIANDVINVLSTMPDLETLELINFDVKAGFEEALCKCVNLRHVLIIPTYIKQSAVTVQRMVMALSGMNHILKSVIWGLTMELLKVTEMLVTQHQFPLEPGVDCTNCVPIMPRICLEIENSPETKKVAQVEVITVDQLRDRLAKEIPLVDVQLIKVPYMNTLSKFLPLK